jgi:uncharacterized membrane protein YgdD (TMEM256/DUF423 family)
MDRTMRRLAAVAAVSGAVAVAAGAFGAHALRDRLDPSLLETFQTGARYHLVHAVIGVAIAAFNGESGARGRRAAAVLFLVGTALFAGSLYALALSGIRALGAITPFGGAALIAGWIVLARALWASADGLGSR